MMKTGGEPDKVVHISLEDQQKINKFARDLVNQSSIFMAELKQSLPYVEKSLQKSISNLT